MNRFAAGALALLWLGFSASLANAQTASGASGLTPGASIAPAPATAPRPSSAAHPQPTPGTLRMSAEADAARRLTDERLRRRDAAARRALQGICKGC